MTEFSAAQKEFIKDLFLKTNNTISEKTEEIRKELKLQVKDIKEEVGCLVGNLQQRVLELETENRNLQFNLLHLERKIRKNNVVIFGVDKSELNIYDAVLNIFKDILELDIVPSDLNDVYRFDSQIPGKSPIVVEFTSFQKKLLVLRNARKLKGKSIYISKDQCDIDRENNKVLLGFLKRERAAGKKAYIKNDKLYVDNQRYTAKQLKDLETEEKETGITNNDSEPIRIDPKNTKKRPQLEPATSRKEEPEKNIVKPAQHSKESTVGEHLVNRVKTRSEKK